MFIIKDEPTFQTKVRIQDPTDKAFHKVAKEIAVEYLVQPPETIAAIFEAGQVARGRGETVDEAAEILTAVVKGWSGIKLGDKDGPEFEFSDENLKRLMALPYVRSAMLDAYYEGVNGKARKGN